MKVSELIEKLKKCTPDADVDVLDEDNHVVMGVRGMYKARENYFYIVVTDNWTAESV